MKIFPNITRCQITLAIVRFFDEFNVSKTPQTEACEYSRLSSFSEKSLAAGTEERRRIRRLHKLIRLKQPFWLKFKTV